MDQNDRPFWPLWPYDSRPQRSALNPRSTVLAAPRNAMMDYAGYAGTQSGQGVVPPSHLATDDWITAQSLGPDYGATGMTGTQSGPTAVEPQIYDELIDILRRYSRGVPQAEPRDALAREFYKYRR